ncbi:helix-turn-helix transcriptional regulator [Microbacteriaceae bacterium VKM Ac-2854]|nr:helix-turn-helix transcriptional regulator [Microbacteriaceae bacterium VKM Ac-2854]
MQPDFGIVTSWFELADPQRWQRHRHNDAHELLWGSRGTVTVETDDGRFVVPPSLGLWIPAGRDHLVAADPGTGFFCSYVSAGPGADLLERTGAVAVPSVVRELLAHLETSELDDTVRADAERLVLALLRPARLDSIDIPMPRDDRLRRIAEGILDRPADDCSLEEWGTRVGGSPRNLSRLFRQETGMSFAQWRLQARMRVAAGLLASGHPVGAVGRRVGYASPSAFVAVFRREMGQTPGEFSSSLAA